MNSVSTQFGKQLVRGLMLAGAMLVAPIASADDFRIESKQGPVESVDYARTRSWSAACRTTSPPTPTLSSAAATARSR